jgi:hypothetical protein
LPFFFSVQFSFFREIPSPTDEKAEKGTSAKELQLFSCFFFAHRKSISEMNQKLTLKSLTN